MQKAADVPMQKAAAIWFVTMLLTAVAVAYAFKHFDVPLAFAMVALFGNRLNEVGGHLGSALFLTGETVTVLGLVIYRLSKGHLSPAAKAVAVGCCCSIAAYAINAGVLKMLFGVAVPGEVIGGARHVAHFLKGSYESSFPSGHMVLAAAFAGVPMRLYPRLVLPLAGLLAVGACLLVAGNWHFLSDVLAGGFVGVTAGWLAGEILAAHERSLAARRS